MPFPCVGARVWRGFGAGLARVAHGPPKDRRGGGVSAERNLRVMKVVPKGSHKDQKGGIWDPCKIMI